MSYCVARRATFNADDETTRRGKLELECSEDKSGRGPTHGLQRIWIPARRRACLVKNFSLLAAVLCCPCGFHERDHPINCNGTGQPEPAVAQEVVRCNARTAFLLLVQSLVVFAAVTSARDWSAYSASHCEGFLLLNNAGIRIGKAVHGVVGRWSVDRIPGRQRRLRAWIGLWRAHCVS